MSELEKHQAEQQMKLFDSLSPSLKEYAREYGLNKALKKQKNEPELIIHGEMSSYFEGPEELYESLKSHQEHDTEWNRLMVGSL